MKRSEAAHGDAHSAEDAGAPPAKRAPEAHAAAKDAPATTPATSGAATGTEPAATGAEPAATGAEAAAAADGTIDAAADAATTAAAVDAKRRALVQKIVAIQGEDRRVAKATAVLARALQEELSPQTAAAFAPALRALLATRPLPALRGGEVARGYAAVFAQVLAKLETAWALPERFEARTWALRGAVHLELTSDDTFRFARACKNVRLALEEMDSACRSSAQTDLDAARAAAPQASAELRLDRCSCLVELLQTLLGMYGRLWARPSVTQIFKMAKERRMLFDEANRERLDEKTNALRQREAQTTLGAKRTADRSYGPLSG